MNLRSLNTKLASLTLSLVMIIALGQSQYVYAGSHADGHGKAGHEEEIEKGPNRGRMLRDGDFAVELSIFENGVPPEFRIFATNGVEKIDVNELDLSVKLTRLGGVVDDIHFYAENNYLRGDMEIYEPHSFQVNVTAEYAGKTYQWTYDNFEGRTQISDQMADAMAIETATIGSEILQESLSVFGKLSIPPSAVRHVSARFPGEIKVLNVTLGQRVKKGQLLMTIESNDSLMPYQVLAPMSGVITAQEAGAGEQTESKSLLTITDTSKLIAELAVYPMDQAKVKPGLPVRLGLTGGEKRWDSLIFDVLPEVNAQQANIYRVYVDNANGQLKAGQYVSADIFLDEYKVPLAVRAEALQAFRDFTVVYAKVGEQYEVRMLELGRQAGPWVEVLGGIDAGTEYVAKNSYIIKADIDKSGASHDH